MGRLHRSVLRAVNQHRRAESLCREDLFNAPHQLQALRLGNHSDDACRPSCAFQSPGGEQCKHDDDERRMDGAAALTTYRGWRERKQGIPEGIASIRSGFRPRRAGVLPKWLFLAFVFPLSVFVQAWLPLLSGLGDGETRLPKRVSRRHTCKPSPLSVMNRMAGGALRTKNFHQGHRHGKIPCKTNSQ
jgi:hypothetical protein